MDAIRVSKSRLLWRLGVTALARYLLARHGRFVLVFHGIASQRRANVPTRVQPRLTGADLRRVLGWLRPRFPLLTPEQFLHSAEPGVLLTFDDGFANLHRSALPLLAEFAAPAVFFVTTGHLSDRREWLPFVHARIRAYWPSATSIADEIAADCFDGLSPAQLAECAASGLVTIASHGVTHSFLPACDEAQLEIELTCSRRLLAEISGQDVDLFAYPAARYDRRVAEAVRGAGYRAGFAVRPLGVGMPAFEIPRIGVDWADPAYLDYRLSGLYRSPIPVEAGWRKKRSQDTMP